MKTEDGFLKAYHDFRETIDLSGGGILPDVDTLIGYLLMGIPRVPADSDLSQNAQLEAVDQRIAILKAVFVETNRNESDDFLDQGLLRYAEAGKIAKELLKDAGQSGCGQSGCGQPS
jgi:hypothetical protein